MSLQTQTLRSKKPVAIKTEASLSVFAYGQAHFYRKPLTFLRPLALRIPATEPDSMRFLSGFGHPQRLFSSFFRVGFTD
ncbi:hypothetical protein [Comamonas testosteroni]|uniref:hypothetical protein n=1 Tax=Comamonas testosteroni TaxID=285 RepID=UPI002DBD5D8A|nr:hypothetical protein [Comamonas testosteroni]MEB5964728.1 hypothetical protein [Comamonas testosteroni]